MNWIKVKLTDISNPKQWKNLPVSEFTEDGYTVYGANGIVGKYKEYNHEFPTLAISCRGANCGSLHITEPKSYITSNAMALDNLSEKVDLKFLYYVLKNRGFSDTITGSAQPQITRENLRKVSFHIPENIEDQIQIANLLSISEGLVKERQESILILDDYLKRTFHQMFGDPSSNSNKFEMGTIRDLVLEVKYGTSKPAEDKGVFPYLRMNNITPDGYMDFTDLKYINVADSEKEKYVVRKGDLLFNRTNSKELVGKTGIFNDKREMIIAGYLIRVKVNAKANPYYLWGFLNSPYGKKTLFKMSKAIVGMANINAQEFQDIKILIPPIALQKLFAEVVSKAEILKEYLNESLHELENLFGSLSQQAFKGELKFISTKQSFIGDPFEGVEIPEGKLPSIEDLDKTKWIDITEPKKENVSKVVSNSAKNYPYETPFALIGKVEGRGGDLRDVELLISKHFKDGYFVFEDLKRAFIDMGFSYEFELLKNFVFELLRKGKIQQVFADASFKSKFTDQHPDFKEVNELIEQMYLQRTTVL